MATEPVSAETLARPRRGEFASGGTGDAAFNAALAAWQYGEIERLIRERDAARREAETFRHDTSVALAALDDAKQLAMRQASEIRRLAGPREPPHCCSCDCRSGS